MDTQPFFILFKVFFFCLLAQVVESLSTPAVADVESERRDSRGCFRQSFFPSCKGTQLSITSERVTKLICHASFTCSMLLLLFPPHPVLFTEYRAPLPAKKGKILEQSSHPTLGFRETNLSQHVTKPPLSISFFFLSVAQRIRESSELTGRNGILSRQVEVFQVSECQRTTNYLQILSQLTRQKFLLLMSPQTAHTSRRTSGEELKASILDRVPSSQEPRAQDKFLSNSAHSKGLGVLIYEVGANRERFSKNA